MVSPSMLQQICDTTAHHSPPQALRKENMCPILRPKRLERDHQVLDEAKGIKSREEAKKLHDVRDGEGSGD